jgi:hypothetical protein
VIDRLTERPRPPTTTSVVYEHLDKLIIEPL